MGLALVDYAASQGLLREVYDRLPEHLLPGLVTAHSLDPDLIPRVFTAVATLDAVGPLSASERALVCTLTARLDRSRYAMAQHAERLRVTRDDDDALAKASLADPHAVAARWPDGRVRALAGLTIRVAETPWALSRADRDHAHAASLSDEDVLHAIMLCACSGHLDRIAHVADVPLDPSTKRAVPEVDTSHPAGPSAPRVLTGRPAIEPMRRGTSHAALAEWRKFIFFRDAPITRRQRTLLARWVATWLGDGGISPPTDLTVNPHDDALRAFAEVVTLAPWRVDEALLAPLRAAGFDDTGIFDAAATITSAGVFSRIEVALVALGA